MALNRTGASLKKMVRCLEVAGRTCFSFSNGFCGSFFVFFGGVIFF